MIERGRDERRVFHTPEDSPGPRSLVDLNHDEANHDSAFRGPTAQSIFSKTGTSGSASMDKVRARSPYARI